MTKRTRSVHKQTFNYPKIDKLTFKNYIKYKGLEIQNEFYSSTNQIIARKIKKYAAKQIN